MISDDLKAEILRLLCEIEKEIPAGGTVELARMIRPHSFVALDALRILVESA